MLMHNTDYKSIVCFKTWREARDFADNVNGHIIPLPSGFAVSYRKPKR